MGVYTTFVLPDADVRLNILAMANTYASIYVHCVFSTKRREALITEKVRERLWSYMGGIARENHMKARCIGGVADHVHLLISMPTSLSIAKGIQQIKGASSVWVRETFPEIHSFAWQEGYGAFSVSKSLIDETVEYIEGQEEHHRHKSFQQEYLAFLRKHEIEFDERYLWD